MSISNTILLFLKVNTGKFYEALMNPVSKHLEMPLKHIFSLSLMDVALHEGKNVPTKFLSEILSLVSSVQGTDWKRWCHIFSCTNWDKAICDVKIWWLSLGRLLLLRQHFHYILTKTAHLHILMSLWLVNSLKCCTFNHKYLLFQRNT